MTIAMSEQVDAEPCDVLRGGDGPVYFLLGGRLYVVHEILGRWIEPDVEPRRRAGRRGGESGSNTGASAGRGTGAGESGSAGAGAGDAERASAEPVDEAQPAQVEHWLVIASVGRFGTPAVFRLQRRPAPPANGPDTWTVRAERR